MNISPDIFKECDTRGEKDGVIIMTPVEELDCPLFTPRTELGKRLSALRAKAVYAGMKLLSEEEVLEEVKRRRGELKENEKDLY